MAENKESTLTVISRNALKTGIYTGVAATPFFIGDVFDNEIETPGIDLIAGLVVGLALRMMWSMRYTTGYMQGYDDKRSNKGHNPYPPKWGKSY